ncbi:MAG: PBP1A family penicillin-binding protein [bacterium]
MSEADRERPGPRPSGRVRQFFRLWAFFTLIVVFLGGGGFVAALLRFQSELPSTAHLEKIEPPSNTRIVDRNGVVLGDLFAEDRLVVPLSEVPETLVKAVLATEDRHFYDHWGVQLPALARAVLANLRAGRRSQGGSTITQQLARNLFLTHERTVTRKIKEALLTIRLERIYSKDEILGMYFNQIYYGNGAYGVKAAAREYFDEDLSELDLAQCAFLAGLPGNPTLFDPRRRFENAKTRQSVVLGAMVDWKAITPEDAAAAREKEIVLADRSRPTMRAPYFVEYVRQQLVEKYGSDRLYGEGLHVVTTLDWRIQEAAEAALEEQLRWLERKNRYDVVRDSSWVAPDKPFVTSPYVQGACIALDTRTGEILAMVGGRNYWESKFNRAVQARRQPGSAFKPFVYTAAIEDGIGASTIILDEPLEVPMPNGDVYKPENTKRDFKGPMTMRTAMSKSVNVPAVRMILTVGPPAAIDVARRCGISGRLNPYPSTALGASEVTLLDITSSYTVYPNLGILNRPWSIREVTDRNGATLERGHVESHEALAAPVAAVMTSIFEDVMDKGTGASARWKGITCPAGGKTGTMDDYADALFVGFTSEVTMGVWVGFDVKRSLGRDMTGTAAALPVWIETMKTALDGTSPEEFPVPPGVTWRTVCTASGVLATPACPETYSEIFVEGDEPKVRCPVHGAEASFDPWDRAISFEELDRAARDHAGDDLEP